MALLLALFLSFVYYPNTSIWLSSILLVFGLGAAAFFTVQKHIPPYKQGKVTHLKLARNILLDILGLILAIAIASYLGGIAGAWASMYGLWTGLAAGMIVGFVGALGVRSCLPCDRRECRRVGNDKGSAGLNSETNMIISGGGLSATASAGAAAVNEVI